jgi:hypothetical protein
LIPGIGSGSSAGAPAAPYPSTITVSGLTAPIFKMAVTLHGFSHTFPDDVDILLVAPDGAKLVLFSDVGDTNDLTNATITLSDDATTALTDSGAVPSGLYRPANFGTVVDPFPATAPAFTSADSSAPGGTATFGSQFAGHRERRPGASMSSTMPVGMSGALQTAGRSLLRPRRRCRRAPF